MSGLVTCEVVAGVAHVRLNRPEKLNALNDELFDELRSVVCEQLPAMEGLRAVVLAGNGAGFCAGRDVGALQPAGGPAGPSSQPGRGQPIVSGLLRLPVPVLAAVHGVAYGGGFQLALGADVRFLAPDTRLAMREIDFGLTPDMGGTQLLPALVGYERAFELTVTGRVVDAAEAVALRLALRVGEDPVAEAQRFAETIADRSPTAIAYAKTLLRAAGSVSLEEGFSLEQVALQKNRGSANQREAVRARAEKRPPVFTTDGIDGAL